MGIFSAWSGSTALRFDLKGQRFRIVGGYEVHTVYAAEAAAGDAENRPRPGRDITFARQLCSSIGSEARLETLERHRVPIAADPRPRGDGATQTYSYDPDGHVVEPGYEPWDWG